MRIHTLTERTKCLPYNGDTYTHRTRRVSALYWRYIHSQNVPTVCLIIEIYTVTERTDCLPYNGDIYTHRTRRVSAL